MTDPEIFMTARQKPERIVLGSCVSVCVLSFLPWYSVSFAGPDGPMGGNLMGFSVGRPIWFYLACVVMGVGTYFAYMHWQACVEQAQASSGPANPAASGGTDATDAPPEPTADKTETE